MVIFEVKRSQKSNNFHRTHFSPVRCGFICFVTIRQWPQGRLKTEDGIQRHIGQGIEEGLQTYLQDSRRRRGEKEGKEEEEEEEEEEDAGSKVPAPGLLSTVYM